MHDVSRSRVDCEQPDGEENEIEEEQVAEAAHELTHERVVVLEKDEHEQRVEEEEASDENAVHVRVEEEEKVIEVSVRGQFVEVRAVVEAFRVIALACANDHVDCSVLLLFRWKISGGGVLGGACSRLLAIRQVRDDLEANVFAVFKANR